MIVRIVLLLFIFNPFLIAKNYISIDGSIKYENLTHFDYVNPNAPKGGILRAYALGTFDSFNQFVVKGTKAEGLELIYDTLTIQSKDEPFSEYGLVACKIETCNNCVIFTINPKARFNDGEPIKPSDVKFSFDILMKYGNPLIKQYYIDVEDVQILNDRQIKFIFSNSDNRELPLILGQLSILPEHFYKDKEFESNPLLIPLGSGPYRIKDFEVGRKITYERIKDYWAINHPTRIGQFNFDEVSYEYYKDDNVALEAFKSKAYDYRLESSAKVWAVGYDGKGKKSGELKQVAFKNSLPSGMQGFFMNTKRDIFSDIRVREALFYAFDFSWSNKNLFFNQYKRTKSFFDNSIFASSGLPSGLELDILKKLNVDSKILDSVFYIPEFNNTQEKRIALLKAQDLLKQAGWKSFNNKLYKDNKPFKFEILLVSKAMERVALPFTENLKILGIDASIRLIDVGSYINRLNHFDYDMIVAVIPQSLFPGNEQRYFWSSQSANTNGSRNYARIESKDIDFLVDNIINAKDKMTQIAYTRALDRILLWGYYVIPHFYSNSFRVAFWDKFEYPAISPLYDFDIFTWWVKEKENKEIEHHQ
ncbi:ABC transporter substrate-binding protein [Helicobacter sp. 16-1353]|uniref:extracellular solute-binding protein n=1 Tax=Helicobacter sp. 16-1353 TaxID=2004996 RepID=UPI000DCBBF7D|nr:extracellular solute-binding protein [Helicobacter sp. 16-1353]RAX52705.1 ABC transporter substrate-binding protein [Helicobacter sp. 16-1353]